MDAYDKTIIGDCTLYQGDSLDILPVKNDLVVTSPPYDNLRDYGGHGWDFETFQLIADKLKQSTKTGSVIVWIVGDAVIDRSETGTSFRQALYFKDICLNLHDTMIYQKNGNPSLHPVVK